MKWDIIGCFVDSKDIWEHSWPPNVVMGPSLRDLVWYWRATTDSLCTGMNSFSVIYRIFLAPWKGRMKS